MPSFNTNILNMKLVFIRKSWFLEEIQLSLRPRSVPGRQLLPLRLGLVRHWGRFSFITVFSIEQNHEQIFS